MQTIAIDQIIIPPDRQRKEFNDDKIQELGQSIRSLGLIHPIVLRLDGRTLVAGERRLRAIQQAILPLGFDFFHNGEVVGKGRIPYTLMSDLSPDQLEEVELDENFRRENLSWQEHSAAVARLHALRVRQAESRGTVHTTGDTAVEVKGTGAGTAFTETRQQILLAKHLDNPAIAKAKNVGEAFKILKKQETAAGNVRLAAETGRLAATARHAVVHGDSLEWMQNYTGPKFDVICTDPPYGMGADTFGDSAGRLSGTDHRYDDSYEHWQGLITRFAQLSWAVAKDQAHCYVWCDFDRFHELKAAMVGAGWYVFRTPILNIKNGGRVPLPTSGPRRVYETCLYAIKGSKPVTAIYADVMHTTGDEQLGHAAQKPVELWTDLLKRSVRPGDRVLDPFAGTGGILPAGHALGCLVTVIEQADAAYGICLNRLKELT